MGYDSTGIKGSAESEGSQDMSAWSPKWFRHHGQFPSSLHSCSVIDRGDFKPTGKKVDQKFLRQHAPEAVVSCRRTGTRARDSCGLSGESWFLACKAWRSTPQECSEDCDSSPSWSSRY